jgi:uncharacterized damage-inducible protein DinB
MAGHLLVIQLRFARSEFVRGLEGVSAADGGLRVPPLNCLSWMVGHLTNQEHRFWVRLAQQKDLAPGLNDLVGYGRPASTPSLDEMWVVWRTVIAAADEYLNTLTPEIMQTHLRGGHGAVDENVGTMLMRNIYHYWYHTGEAAAVRQLLGHTNLPEFVGDMDAAAYRPEAD